MKAYLIQQKIWIFLENIPFLFRGIERFFHDVIEGMLVFQEKEAAAILVNQTSPWMKIKLPPWKDYN